LKEHERALYFATGNRGKYTEAARIAEDFGIHLKQLDRPKMEIQSDDLREIATFAVNDACHTIKQVAVAEDSGFFVDALDGFPGPYSSYVFRTIGNRGVLKLLHSASNRRAHFQAVVAFCAPDGNSTCFSASVSGTVTSQPRGSHGFGFDPIFAPSEGDGRTFAQMNTNEKNLLSHRGRAFVECFQWLVGRPKLWAIQRRPILTRRRRL
jgi:XTP/dITP diphosphohydrolase